MKTLLMFAVISLALTGCAETPNTQTTRHQIDDLRDEDADGIINQRDRCLDTPENVAVDNTGCANWDISDKPVVVSVDFDFDEAILRVDQDSKVTKLVDMLEQYPNSNVVLIGDTSSEGTDDYNKALAKRRTAAIKQALETQGIESERVSEQEFTQTTYYTEQLHKRKRRTIAVFYRPEMKVTQEWDIFTSEKSLSSSTQVEAPSE
ncbi:OmpA family protein [Vibrio sp. 10N.261.51.F12]|uniref:OmpA family protein n=1 Tax=Vibrio sp. 10N.261.51.F12 TaxID=3229679 RepID=UPI00354F8B3B